MMGIAREVLPVRYPNMMVLGLVLLLTTACMSRVHEPREVNRKVWKGPDQAVVSMDSTHCLSTETTRSRGLPGWISISEGEYAGSFWSTDEQIPWRASMREAGYSMGRFRLLLDPADLEHLYVQKGGEDLVNVYRSHGCK